ncbi:hypothetical protein, partial [Alistipes ihumii]
VGMIKSPRNFRLHDTLHYSSAISHPRDTPIREQSQRYRFHLSFPNEDTLRKEIHIDIYGSTHHNYYFGNKQPFLYKSIVIGVTLHLSNLRFG